MPLVLAPDGPADLLDLRRTPVFPQASAARTEAPQTIFPSHPLSLPSLHMLRCDLLSLSDS